MALVELCRRWLMCRARLRQSVRLLYHSSDGLKSQKKTAALRTQQTIFDSFSQTAFTDWKPFTWKMNGIIAKCLVLEKRLSWMFPFRIDSIQLNRLANMSSTMPATIRQSHLASRTEFAQFIWWDIFNRVPLTLNGKHLIFMWWQRTRRRRPRETKSVYDILNWNFRY